MSGRNSSFLYHMMNVELIAHEREPDGDFLIAGMVGGRLKTTGG